MKKSYNFWTKLGSSWPCGFYCMPPILENYLETTFLGKSYFPEMLLKEQRTTGYKKNKL